MPAEIVHIEFKSANFARTAEFYARLFDWQTEQNGSGSYMKLNAGAGGTGPTAGWVRADLIQAPAPVAFLAVDDLEKTLQAVEAAGGRVLVRSQPFAGGGEVGLFVDPDGNVLGLWRRKGGAAPAAAGTPGTADSGAKPAAKPAKAPKPPKPPGPPKKPAKKR